VFSPDLGRDIAPESYWLCCATNSGAVADAKRIQQMPGDFLTNYLNEKLESGVTGRRFPMPVAVMEAAE
jgi:hypothetical protein